MTSTIGELRPSDQNPQLDPSQWPATLDGSVTPVLGAVGSLLVAIAGDGRPAPLPAPADGVTASASPASSSSRPQPEPTAAARSGVQPDGSPRKSESVAAGIFSPEDGSLLLRVTPVSGFQALIRVPDTLMRLSSVREATVEEYSEGEARLRLRLSAPVEPSSLAASLGEGLAQESRVAAVSLPERSLKVALGG